MVRARANMPPCYFKGKHAGVMPSSCRNTYVVAENKETIRASAHKSSNLAVP